MSFSAGALVSDGTNKVSSMRVFGVSQANPEPAAVQQGKDLARLVQGISKGSLLSVTVENAGATTQAFRLFDPYGVAAAAGMPANGADITITSTFAGLNSAAGYEALKSWLGGNHIGSIGSTFLFGSEATISSSNLKVWNGNIETYNQSSLKNNLTMAKDTYANDQKTLVVKTMLYLNGLFAVSGQLPAGGSMELLLNVQLFRNF